MKTTKEIIGLRIISIADGTQVGFIKDFVLNPQLGAVDFLVVDEPTGYFGAKVIPFTKIAGLGEFALTIPDVHVIEGIAQNPAAQDLLRQDVHVIGCKVLTKKGELAGEVYELLIDEETGKIASCLYTGSDDNRLEVTGQQVITYGKELLIIEGEPKAVPSPVVVEEPQVEDSDLATDGEVSQDEGFNLFEQRQLQYFIGKTLDQTIVLDNGETLNAGAVITEGDVAKITTRKTLMDVMAHLTKM